MGQLERRYVGVGVSEGISIGIAHVRETGIIDVPEHRLEKKDLVTEEKRLAHAVSLTKRQVRRIKSRVSRLPKPASKELSFLLDAYLHMLDDSRLVRGAQERVKQHLINA